jgi:hypothetical protein
MSAQYELDDLDLVVTTQSAATINPTATTDEDLDSAPAITSQSLDWGTAAPISLGDGLDRIRPKAGEVVRFAIIPNSAPLMSKVHFIALAGKTPRFYVCAGAVCLACKSGDAPKTSIVALVAQYTNADPVTGKLGNDVVPNYKVGYLSLSPTAFNTILEAPVEGSRPTDVDFAMSFDGRRYSFRVIASNARHIHRKETAQIIALAKPFETRLSNKLGATMPANAVVAVAPPVAEGMDD